MAISAQPADTQPSPTLMDRVLPCPIKNRVGFGLKRKTNKTLSLISLKHLAAPSLPSHFPHSPHSHSPWSSITTSHHSISPPAIKRYHHWSQALSPSAITWSHLRPFSVVTADLKLYHRRPWSSSQVHFSWPLFFSFSYFYFLIIYKMLFLVKKTCDWTRFISIFSS